MLARGRMTKYAKDVEVRIVIFSCRVLIYLLVWASGLSSMQEDWREYRSHDTVKLGRIVLPSYLLNWQDVASLV